MAAAQKPNQPLTAIPPEISQAINDLKTASTGAVGKITELAGRITTSMTPAEVAAVQADLKSVTDALNSAAAIVVP
jgi:hypothetical protein